MTLTGARCADHPTPDLWHDQDTHPQHPDTRAAVAICRACPVAAACLRLALRTERPGSRFGIWGGTTPRDRRRMMRHT